MKKQQDRIRSMAQSAMIAALYVALTFAANMAGLASGAVQLRLSEALTVLPVFTPAAVPGLFVGCALSNLLTGGALWDVVAGSAATLLGAVGTRMLRRHKILCLLPPIAANTLIVPFVLEWVYMAEGTIPFFMLTVGIGEVLSCGVLGWILRSALEKYGKGIHWAK